MLQIGVRELDEVLVVDCTGDIVYGEGAASLRQQVKDLFLRRQPVVLNLAEVRNLDSNGVGTLVSLMSSARSAGVELRLAALGKRMRDVLQVTKLTDLFAISETVEAAVESLRLVNTPVAIGEVAR